MRELKSGALPCVFLAWLYSRRMSKHILQTGYSTYQLARACASQLYQPVPRSISGARVRPRYRSSKSRLVRIHFSGLSLSDINETSMNTQVHISGQQ